MAQDQNEKVFEFERYLHDDCNIFMYVYVFM